MTRNALVPLLRASVLGCTVLAMGCPTPDAEPSLWICSSQTCVEQALAAEIPESAEPCAELGSIESGTGFYALHVVPDRVELADDAQGQLVVETICDRRELELDYSEYPDHSKVRAAVVPLLATEALACGATIRATLFDSTLACTRPLGDDPTSCAKLLDECPSPEPDESSTAATESSSTDATADGGTGSTTGP
jgi:hypothetical protein